MAGVGRRELMAMTITGLMVRASSLHAQERIKSGTVAIEQVQVAFIGSGNIGGGTLEFQGGGYPFSVGGLGVGGFGISRMEATGDVYNLKELQHFPGAYVQARYGFAAGDVSGGQLWLENTNHVLLNLRARRTGLALSLGADAVFIDFK